MNGAEEASGFGQSTENPLLRKGTRMDTTKTGVETTDCAGLCTGQSDEPEAQPHDSRFDLTGKTFGKLTALRCVDGTRSRGVWECRCACGKMKNVKYHSLTQGDTTSCGCSRAQMKDLTGQRFGRLTAMENTGEKKGSCYVWRCMCDCGRETLATSTSLLKGDTRSCGCMREEAKRNTYQNIQGRRFGRLVALEPMNKRRGGSVVWKCQCDCGNMSEHSSNALMTGAVKSCGCLKKENDSLKKSLHYIDGTCVEFLENMGKLRCDNTSGYPGLKYVRGKWTVRITFKGKTYTLGTYADKEEAIRVRKRGEQAIFGEFLDWYYAEFPDKKTSRRKRDEAAAEKDSVNDTAEVRETRDK